MRSALILMITTLAATLSAPAADAAEGDAYGGATLRAARPACKRIAALRAAPAISPVVAPDTNASPWSHSATLSWFDTYAWRGQLITDDPVLQPSVTIGWNNFSANIWANVDLTDINGNEGEVNEVDYTLDWTHRFEGGTFPWSLSLGIIHYDFPNTTFDATTELYAVISSELPLNPTFSIYRDIDEVDGTYASLDLSHAFPLGERVSLAVGAGLAWGDRGYNASYWGVADAGWNDVHLSAALPIALGQVTITPSLTWYSLVDELVRDGAAEPENLVLGISLDLAL